MKHSIACWSLFVFFGLMSVFAKEAPTSAEQLRNEVEAAFRAKDTNAYMSLFNWQSVSEKMKTTVGSSAAFSINQDIAAVTLSPLPTDFRLTNVLNGIRYTPNVAVVGLINVEFAKKGNSMKMPYGKQGDSFYITGTVEEQIPGPLTKSKALSVIVRGFSTDAENLSGSFVFVNGGEEIKENFSGKGQFSKSFMGDYIKSCTVQKTSIDQRVIQLIIEENGKRIFESQKVTNKEPIVYVK